MATEDDQQQQSNDQFAHEEDLRQQSESEPLGGCDVEHCQRMHE